MPPTPTPRASAPELLVLHGVRILGFASAARVGERFGLAEPEVTEVLLDDEARGWVRRDTFAGLSGWSLTASGRAEGQRLVADELAATGAGEVVAAAYRRFEELNARFLQTVTDWQIRPTPADPMAANDHTEWGWDERVFDALGSLGRQLAPVCAALAGVLRRFEGYAARYREAVARVDAGQRAYVADLGVDSCHTVWMQLHEDLIATLGLARG